MDTTALIWQDYDRHPGNRESLFRAVAESFPSDMVLYPGSYIDIAASFVFDDVTYVDMDARAATFFRDVEAVDQLIARHTTAMDGWRWRFINADYSRDLGLEDGSFDLLVSLYAGFVSRACGRYLRDDGLLLVNSNHGDVAMASIDPAFQLVAVVNHRSGRYTVTHVNLDTYLIPKAEVTISVATVEASGRGIPYTRSPFAYVFRRSVG